MDVGKQERAMVRIGGERNLLHGDFAGYYCVEPTILEGTNDMRICQEEIFGAEV